MLNVYSTLQLTTFELDKFIHSLECLCILYVIKLYSLVGL